MKKKKTNALRILEQHHIFYEIQEYEYDENHLSGEHIVHQVDLDAQNIYKTLVLKGTKDYLVCCIPVNKEIDLKKLAKATNHKSVEMLHQKDLLPLTGYIRGGCSPIGMKKKYTTYIDETAILFDKIAVSAGIRGQQILISPEALIAFVQAIQADITKDIE